MLSIIKNKPLIIAVPDKIPLLIEDGFSYAETVLSPLTHAIVKGPQEIIITIPDDRPIFTSDRKQRTIQGEFFAGLFQNLLIGFRDEYEPKIKQTIARNNMPLAIDSNDAPQNVDAMDALSDIFQKVWVTYDPVERAFWKKVSIGLQKTDGNILLAEIKSNRQYMNDMSTPEGKTLYLWTYQVGRGLDAAFGHDLSIDPANPSSRFDQDIGTLTPTTQSFKA